eukprot:m.209542 g.209542  ORF g.209542 m.209542 type:complete len:61 (-) comp33041_c1_seq4:178-360(-)
MSKLMVNLNLDLVQSQVKTATASGSISLDVLCSNIVLFFEKRQHHQAVTSSPFMNQCDRV